MYAYNKINILNFKQLCCIIATSKHHKNDANFGFNVLILNAIIKLRLNLK